MERKFSKQRRGEGLEKSQQNAYFFHLTASLMEGLEPMSPLKKLPFCNIQKYAETEVFQRVGFLRCLRLIWGVGGQKMPFFKKK